MGGAVGWIPWGAVGVWRPKGERCGGRRSRYQSRPAAGGREILFLCDVSSDHRQRELEFVFDVIVQSFEAVEDDDDDRHHIRESELDELQQDIEQPMVREIQSLR